MSAFLWVGSASAAEALSIAVENDAGPWSKADGSGFANEVVQAAFKAAGIETVLNVVPYARCKDMVLNGKACACFSMSWHEDLADKVDFSDKPLFVCHSDYFFSVKALPKASREGELPAGTRLGVVIGYEYPPNVYVLQKKGVLVLEESESEDLNLKKLMAGHLDAALINTNALKPAESLLAGAGVAGQVKRAFASGPLKSYIGFSRLHPQGAWARKKFNQGYRRLASGGGLKKIERAWKERALEK